MRSYPSTSPLFCRPHGRREEARAGYGLYLPVSASAAPALFCQQCHATGYAADKKDDGKINYGQEGKDLMAAGKVRNASRKLAAGHCQQSDSSVGAGILWRGNNGTPPVRATCLAETLPAAPALLTCVSVCCEGPAQHWLTGLVRLRCSVYQDLSLEMQSSPAS